ncbi:hypothetical protein ACN3XK_69790, partial [Actinomadura welshii]
AMTASRPSGSGPSSGFGGVGEAAAFLLAGRATQEPPRPRWITGPLSRLTGSVRPYGDEPTG